MDKIKVNEKPQNEQDFRVWLEKELGYKVDSKYEYYYETITKKLKSDFEASSFWQKLISELDEINYKYLKKTGVHLLIPTDIPQICIKPLNSLLIKAYRKNILNNSDYPNPPKSGWLTPENWFEMINDILRTTITVKYLDGASFILDEIKNIAEQNASDFSSSFEAREEGYYAAHSGVKLEFNIPSQTFEPVKKIMNVEIQITTQIQGVIKSLLHKHYEEKRKCESPKDYKWQWDHKSAEFIPNYLGHIIHYVEGMIIDIRDKQK